ncbi:phenylalanyl-tRNA synthetase subunit alpha [Rhodonellum psychrophilum GCM71 = DSM 17998]|uniref:Phenylalanine--tRNA ligase alpha subunit n=2 Tax=Rhodonellum TaxID=336827 RepID=U5BWF5_9BACT|nr:MULTISPECIES: phenylalanine--tRNA ligase subunit alpha [Rhodonellum]ERM81869.1 phenylalanyl-tRNA synthetase subunit alpha [Rhodonellum psychrophilum GCM71 = DSM 17998]MDO9554346.1 phenylalanine--tRNA ligase subunit alpha [Rhodonellum sp.]SDY67451.1 phenylalanyl-tRNA synthetase, alpha subunit [Rhodonellum ikkaensis]
MHQDKVAEIKNAIAQATASSPEELEAYRMEYISKKSVVGELFAEMKNIPNEEKKVFGQVINELKQLAEEKFQELIERVNTDKKQSNAFDIDLTLPPSNVGAGGIHPLTATRQRIIEIFERIGFNLSEGPEIEDDWHNFTALNFPINHPAREMQDTFFIEKDPDIALRTHTSSVQVRVMENQKPPIRTLSPGRVYRNEAISARAHCIFHQVEGLYVDENVGFADLKNTLYHFAKEMFGKETKVRFRPSFFPFTEPSAEIDISCQLCGGKGCNICKGSGWVEIGGSGMVDPNVLDNCGIDSKKYTGFAFGMGIERIAMLKYQIKDLRLFTENDVRFLKQFKPML